MSEVYAVTGATGNIGKKVAEALLAKGQKVRAVSRNEKNLKPLIDKGAEAFVGSVNDAQAMKTAFKGAKAVFTLIPPNPSAQDFRSYQNEVSEVFASAIRGSKVEFVVNLSSVGAHLGEKVGPIKGLHDNEQRLNQLKGVHIVHLRPAYFLENLLYGIGLIKQMGINGSPLRGDLAIPMIATKDIASAASKLLLDLDFNGTQTRELLGQREITMTEATAVLGKAIGKPELKYAQFPYEDAEKAMTGMGMSKDVAKGMIELNQAFNEGVLKPAEKRSSKNSTPTSIEEFAAVFATVYNAQESPETVKV